MARQENIKYQKNDSESLRVMSIHDRNLVNKQTEVIGLRNLSLRFSLGFRRLFSVFVAVISQIIPEFS